jgi:hypothetical protein
MKLGYSALVEAYGLSCLPHYRTSEISTRVKGQQLAGEHDGQLVYRFEPKYQPDDTLIGQLEFALKYDGINLEILKALVGNTKAAPDLEKWLRDSPTSIYARKAGYLYEWLTGHELATSGTPNAAYIDLLDADAYVVSTAPLKNRRYRVNDNLLGTPSYCPMVRRTETIASYQGKNIDARIRELIEPQSEDLIERAVGFLYMKETQSTFQIEREKPSPDKVRRFVELLARAPTIPEITEQTLVEVQNAVIDPRFQEFSYRPKQTWVGDALGEHRVHIEYIPPAPGDLPDLMTGLLELIARTKRSASDAVAAAAACSFGFVYLHPFNDGNGRTHRFLIHYLLERDGFTPENTIIPVSAAMLATPKQYRSALNAFSKPLMRRLKFRYAADEIDVANNYSDYYRYFDATAQTEYLYEAIDRAVAVDLREEIEFLIAFEKARTAIDAEFDLPSKELSLLIRTCVDNVCRLSKTKREKFFPGLSDEEVSRIEEILQEAFAEHAKLRASRTSAG